jgi:hypothetical protein
MAIAALMVAAAALALGAVAYWRVGGKRDVELLRRQLERELDLIRAKQDELFAGASEALFSAYDDSRRRLERNRQRLRTLRAQAAEGLEQQLDRAAEQLPTIADRLENAAKKVTHSTLTAARLIEGTVARRVRRLEARLQLLAAKVRAIGAVQCAEQREFEIAERQLARAAELLRNARRILRGDGAFDEGLEAVKRSLTAASNAIRAKAEDTRRRIEDVVTETNTLVGSLEAEEDRSAAEHGEEAASSQRAAPKI